MANDIDNEELVEKPEDETIDFNEIRRNFRDKENPDPWIEGLGVYENLTHLLLCSTLLPDEDIQIPIIVAFLMLPHPVLELAPILWVQGGSGSGKSQIAAIAKFLNKYYMLVYANTTVAGIRNTVNSGRFVDFDPRNPTKDPRERHFLLIIDNAPVGYSRRDENTQLMLLQGTTRSSDETRMSGDKTGSVMVFHTFSRKLVVSVGAVGDNEVLRRSFLVECKKSDSSDVADLIDFTTLEFDWTEHFLAHWTRENLVRFKDTGLTYPKHEFIGDKNRIFYYRDIFSILTMAGVDNPMEIINAFEGRDIMRVQQTTLQQALTVYVVETLGSRSKISTASLMNFINARVRDDDFDRPTALEIEDAMGALGYKKKWQTQGGFSWER